MPADLNRASLSDLLERMKQSGVADNASLVGCTADEIQALEAKYGVRLPNRYRAYLASMGHQSGRLFSHDHLAVDYAHVLPMTEEVRAEVSGWAAEVLGPMDRCFFILGRLWEHFEFIRCEDGNLEDSPVWLLDVYERRVSPAHASVLQWLEAFCEEAESAIASGYFRDYPEGTRP